MKLSIWSSYYMELKAEDAVLRLIDNGIYSRSFPMSTDSSFYREVRM